MVAKYSSSVSLIILYKEMLTVHYSSGAIPGQRGGSGAGKYNVEGLNQYSKRFNSQVRRNNLPIWVWLIYGLTPHATFRNNKHDLPLSVFLLLVYGLTPSWITLILWNSSSYSSTNNGSVNFTVVQYVYLLQQQNILWYLTVTPVLQLW